MNNQIKDNNIIKIVFLISSFIIVIFNNLNINWYTKGVMIPFTVMLISYIYLFNKTTFIIKRGYYLLIPIILILISFLIVKIDYSNMVLNIIIIPILLSIFFLSLTNKNYKISSYFIDWIFKIFPDGLISNLKYLKSDNDNKKNSNTSNIVLGVIVGGIIGLIILRLLRSADDYFNAFIGNIVNKITFDPGNLILFIVSFILLFSIFINILLNKNTKIETKEKRDINDVLVITILSIVNMVFVLFIVSEASRLTTNFLQLPMKYTYSSYAREGFFQLLGVTLINFSIILFLIYKTTIIKNSNKVKKLLLLLIIFSILLIFNSYYRMFLYINSYCFTVLRLQVILFLTMELVILILLIKKIISNLKKDAYIYFVILISFYIVNLYICNNSFIRLFN